MGITSESNTRWLNVFSSGTRMAREIGIHEPDLPEGDVSSISELIVDDAKRRAGEIVGEDRHKYQAYVHQLLGTYLEARNRDVVIIFNSGGWGWNLTEETPGWTSILEGIRSELARLGYSSLVLNYRRCGKGITGCYNEFLEQYKHYPRGAPDLASRVSFLTDHLPDLRVIITGESTGSVITDHTMSVLGDNERVFSIQTGTPFWHKPRQSERTLHVNSNGKGDDSFSYGNIREIIKANIKSTLGFSSPHDNPGTILSWLKAPGHHYAWEYPSVSSKVVKFLEEHFSRKAPLVE